MSHQLDEKQLEAGLSRKLDVWLSCPHFLEPKQTSRASRFETDCTDRPVEDLSKGSILPVSNMMRMASMEDPFPPPPAVFNGFQVL